jgi:hypothetical protein
MLVFVLMGSAQAAENLALGKPVVATGPTWPGLAVETLTDGNPSTFTHPAADAERIGFHFEVDLGQEFQLDRILIRNRNDGCCPERLTRYRVEVWSDQGGETGELRWSAEIRADGSHSGVGGIDTITGAARPGQAFRGRFLRIVNPIDAPYQPQLAEIEVYGAPGPEIRLFVADDDTLESGGSTRLRWDVVNATSIRIHPEVGVVNTASGDVEVRPTVRTLYTLTAGNGSGSVSTSILVGVNEVLLPPDLTEFLASNARGLQDEDGDRSDWLELYNPNPFRLDVGGYFLTDDPRTPRGWMLPPRLIPPFGHLIVFASGKNRAVAARELHTHFRLGADGEYLALVSPDGSTVIRQYPENYPAAAQFPAQTADISYGREASGRVGFFRPPTPGATNGPAFAGVVAPVEFSQARGFYDSNLVVTLSCATPGAVIRYTTDRTEPSATRGLVYSEPVVVNRTLPLRVAAFREDWAPTPIVTHTYILPTNVIASSVMRRSITTNAEYAPQMRAALLDVPSLSVVTPAAISGDREVAASIEWLSADGQPGFQEYCGVRHFGGAFTDFAKKSFRLYFRSEYGTSRLKYPLFAGFERGLAAVDEFDQLDLRSGSHDMEMRGFYLSNAFVDDTLLEAGHLNPHGRFVHLYLNGTYWGLYHLRERWGAAMHARYLGGSRSQYESINGNWNVGGWPDPGVPYDGDGSTWTRVKSLRSQYTEVRPWLDVPEYIDFMVTWMFGGAEDEYRCVGPTLPGSGFKFYLNDADGWFCIPQYCAADNRTSRGSPGRQAGDGPGSLFSMLLRENHSEYRTLLADRIEKALGPGGFLTPERNVARLNRRVAEISRPFLAESARWGYLTPTAWAARRDSVLNAWLPVRTGELMNQFRGAGFLPTPETPRFAPAGGPVTLGQLIRFGEALTGSIYYTDDGSDPRLADGSPSPSARLFQAGGESETLISAGAPWRWFTDAIGLGAGNIVEGHASWSAANWKHPGFNDQAWSEGRAQLGYGEGDEATVLPFGDPANKWNTAYFRHRFRVDRSAEITSLLLRLKRDDGAVVYLNGREATRSSMEAGLVTATTRALNASDDGQLFQSISLSPDLLREGTNVIAVELHQSTAATSDASFDLELRATRPGVNQGELPRIWTNTVLRARSREGIQWSGLVESFFQTEPTAVSPGDLAVVEFFPSPADPEDSEFLELANVSSHAINLRGAQFNRGITFLFSEHHDTLLAPGQRLLLVSDLLRFHLRHGIDIPVAGVFQGRLNNAGERLTLVGVTGEPLLDFSFGGPGWAVEADGGGYSLVLIRPELGYGNPAAWRISSVPGGHPGQPDSRQFAGTLEEDLDADGLPALLEYALGTRDDDPGSGSSAMTVQFASESGQPTVFRVIRRGDVDDVESGVEHSADLETWVPARRQSTTPTGTGWMEEEWEAPAPAGPSQFVRLRVRLR